MKNKVIYGLIIIMVFCSMFIGFNFRSVHAYQVVVDDECVALYESQDEAKKYADKIKNDLDSRYDVDVKLESRIEIEQVNVRVNSEDLNTCENVDEVTDSLKAKIKGFSIVLDDKETGLVVKNTDVMDPIIQKFVDKLGIETEDYILENKIEYQEKFYDETDFSTLDQVENFFLTPYQAEKIHTVVEGDTLWDISNKYDISLERIQQLNPGITENLKLGQEVKIEGSAYRLSIINTKNETREQTIPYETETKETDELYVRQQKVEQKGENGIKEISYKVYYRNGQKYEEEKLSEKVIKEPVNEIVLKGTKQRSVATISSRSSSYGNISRPAAGYISSAYGARGGTHTGVDIAGPYGSNVYAAMSGKVIFAGWSGNYGKLIKIQHSNGLVTYYAHLSSFGVKTGQQVSAGQRIGATGSTGNSTGPHLHFEVRKNGTPINPMGYVK